MQIGKFITLMVNIPGRMYVQYGPILSEIKVHRLWAVGNVCVKFRTWSKVQMTFPSCRGRQDSLSRVGGTLWGQTG